MYSREPCNILRHRCPARWSGPAPFAITPGPRVQKKLILASSSPFRKQLLERLHLDFECRSPDVDESTLAGEDAPDYVRRLAQSKAQAIAATAPGAVVIGSDQCAVLDGDILGKPGHHENTLRQLRRAQGKSVVFRTAVCVMHLDSGFNAVEEVPFEVEFRQLTDAQLEHYLRVEQPYQCAGSFKAEDYGSVLFSRMHGDDPSALIGLPLFKLVEMLEAVGIEVV